MISPMKGYKLYKKVKPLYLNLYLNGGVKFFYKDVILVDSAENKEVEINFDIIATLNIFQIVENIKI